MSSSLNKPRSACKGIVYSSVRRS